MTEPFPDVYARRVIRMPIRVCRREQFVKDRPRAAQADVESRGVVPYLKGGNRTW